MKRQSRDLFVVGFVFALITGACTAPTPPPTPTAAPTFTPAPTSTPSPLDIVQAFQDTLNQKDADGFLALFSDDIIYWWGDYIYKPALRNFIEVGFEVNSKYLFSDCQVNGNRVTCTVVEPSDCVPVDLVGETFVKTFLIADGRITTADADYSSNDGHNADIEKFTADRDAWALENMPDDYAIVNDAREYVKFTGHGDQGSGQLTAKEFGQTLARICAGYAATLE